MTRSPEFDLIIIGGGSAGLTGARFGAKLGVRVALVEKHRIGGDCTWTGCVPSKALLKAAKLAHEARRASAYGIDVSSPTTDMRRVRQYIERAQATVYAEESPEVLEQSGIHVVHGAASFVDPNTLRVGERTLSARYIVVCTGARPATPPVPGLADVPYVTYETIFQNEVLPAHLVVLGAGPIGLELAQAYRRLGAEVTVIGEEFLPREEPEARRVVERVLVNEGIRCLQGRASSVRREGSRIAIGTTTGEVAGDMLLVATGRRPNVSGLDLERAGIAYSEKGIVVDEHLRTHAPSVYAAGDVIGGAQFTHLAGWQCFQAVRNALLPGAARGVAPVVPAVTFVDPEVAGVGLSEAAARERFPDVEVFSWDMAHADRAVCDGEMEGFVKVVTRGGRRIVGATIVASRAGEMIGELALAIQHGLVLADLAATIHAYPTWSMAIQQLAAAAAVDDFVGGPAGRLAMKLSRWTL